ncbi:hypothetical protein ACOMHN_045354 [Nucella lapillus]
MHGCWRIDQIHGELRSHLRGQFPDLEFFVDMWPRPQAALARVDPDGQQAWIHGELRSHLRGQFPDLEFFVDRWPRPQAALARVDPDGQQLSCKAFFRHSVEGLYGVSEEALSILLTDPTAVDWNTRTHFFSMSASLQPVMQTIAQRMGRRVHFDHNLLFKHCPRLVPALPVPEGMVCRPISSAADIDIVSRTWKYTNEDTTAFIHHLVHQYPSTYLSTEQGQHIGHVLGISCNSSGVMYLNPECRRKGYAKIISTHMLQRFLEYGEETVYAVLEESNTPAVEMILSLGSKVETKLFSEDGELGWAEMGTTEKQQPMQ